MQLCEQLASVNTVINEEYDSGNPFLFTIHIPAKPEIKVTNLDPPRYFELQDFNAPRRGQFPIRGLMWTIDENRRVEDLYCVVVEQPTDSMYGYSLSQTMYNGLVKAVNTIRH
jgi:hypothetical protein